MSFFLILSLYGCENQVKLETNTNSKNTIVKNSKEYLKEPIECQLLLKVLEKECTQINAHLKQPSLRKINLLVPSKIIFNEKCANLQLGKIPVLIEQTNISIDSFKNIKYVDHSLHRYFYLVNDVRDENVKAFDILYNHSGSIFKIEAKYDGEGWLITDSFCAKY